MRKLQDIVLGEKIHINGGAVLQLWRAAREDKLNNVKSTLENEL